MVGEGGLEAQRIGQPRSLATHGVSVLSGNRTTGLFLFLWATVEGIESDSGLALVAIGSV